MKKLSINKQAISLLAIVLPLLLTFIYVAVRSGPLAPVIVTVSSVEKQSLSPALFGIGIVEARYRYRIGPTITGHVLQLTNHVGDRVTTGQRLGNMDPVDIDNKVAASNAASKRVKASIVAATARVTDTVAREQYAQAQFQRYEALVRLQTVSKQLSEEKYQAYQIAKASLVAARANLSALREELEIQREEHAGLVQQRNNLYLISPVDGLVVGRYVEPGSTAVAGQTVLEVIDPTSIWINVRFDQLHASGLAMNLPAQIMLRSRSGNYLSGYVARVEPLADAVTEEILAKVAFDQLPGVLPPLGELAEVNITLAPLPSSLVVSNVSIKYRNGKAGVWLVENSSLQFVPVKLGASDMEGSVQILAGLNLGDRIVVYSKQALTENSRINIVDTLVADKK